MAAKSRRLRSLSMSTNDLNAINNDRITCAYKKNIFMNRFANVKICNQLFQEADLKLRHHIDRRFRCKIEPINVANSISNPSQQYKARNSSYPSIKILMKKVKVKLIGSEISLMLLISY